MNNPEAHCIANFIQSELADASLTDKMEFAKTMFKKVTKEGVTACDVWQQGWLYGNLTTITTNIYDTAQAVYAAFHGGLWDI